MAKRIFVISQPSVIDGVGGAITVFWEFCNMLAQHGYEVTGMCFAEKNLRPKKLDEGVNFVNLRFYAPELSYSQALNDYAQHIRPDMFVFFFADLYADANLSAEFNDIPRILMSHSRPDVYMKKSTVVALRSLYKNTVTQVLFPSFVGLLPDFIRKGRVVCIPNGVELTDKAVDRSEEHHKIIYLSRVDENKGLEFLIDSFALIAHKYPQWQLDVYGYVSPDYLTTLENRAKSQKIAAQFHFCGITDKPLQTMLKYDFCVFPSYFEGQSIGLIEALSVGLPAVGLKGCTGVNEQIIDKVNGFLTDFNEKKYAEKIELLIKDKELRRQMSTNAIDSCRKYDKSRIWQMWRELIENIFSGNWPYPQLGAIKAKYKIFSLKKINAISNGYILPSWLTIQRLPDKITLYLFKAIKISFKRKGENK